LGKEFIQKIFTAQELALSRDDRQLLDFVGQAKFLIAIGPSEGWWRNGSARVCRYGK
jgi:hypothetical protein